MTALKYLQAYPVALQQQVRQLIDEQRLGDYLSQRYPGRHAVQSDKALYSYALELKQEYLRNAPAIDKVLFDNRLDLTHRALGLHTTVSRVQGGKLKAKKEIRIASLFKEAAPEFLRMIVVHELALQGVGSQQGVLQALRAYAAGLSPAGVRPAGLPDLARPARQGGSAGLTPEGKEWAMDVSKTKSSFYRRLYVAYLIDSGLASSVPALTEVTGMPRRTAQDTIAALADLDILCEFEQQDGARNHAGRYRIHNWGAIDKGWIEPNLRQIKAVLGYP